MDLHCQFHFSTLSQVSQVIMSAGKRVSFGKKKLMKTYEKDFFAKIALICWNWFSSVIFWPRFNNKIHLSKFIIQNKQKSYLTYLNIKYCYKILQRSTCKKYKFLCYIRINRFAVLFVESTTKYQMSKYLILFSI